MGQENGVGGETSRRGTPEGKGILLMRELGKRNLQMQEGTQEEKRS